MGDVSFSFRGDPSDASRAAEQVERALEELSRQALQTGATMRTALANLGTPLRDTRDQIDQVTSATDRQSSASRRMSRALLDMNGQISKANRGFAFFRNIISLIKLPALIAGIGALAQALAAAAAGAGALVAALAPLSGLIAALPAGIGVLVASVTTVKLAFTDLKEALDGNAEAIKRLTPEARRFAAVLNGLKPLIRDIRRDAQRGLFPGLERGLRQALTTQNVAAIRGLVRGIGAGLGRGAAGIGQVLGQRGGDIRLITQQQVQLVNRFAALMPGLTRAFLDLTVAAAPLVDHLAAIIEGFAEWVTRSIAAGRASGDLQRFLEQTADTLDDLIELSVDFGAALKNILSAGAGDLGRQIIRDLGGAAERLREITEEVGTENKLRKYFEDAQPAIYETGRLLRDITVRFLQLGTTPGLADLIRLIRLELVPALFDVLESANEAFGPALIRALANVLRLFGQFVAPGGPLTTFVELIGDAAGKLADFSEQHPNLSRLVTQFVAIAGIVKAISFVAAISGLRRLIIVTGQTRRSLQLMGATGATANGRIRNSARLATASTQTLRGNVALVGPTAVVASATTVTAMGRIGIAVRTLGLLIKSTLISTGIGALIVAAGLLAEQMIFHMDRVKRVWNRIWNEIKLQAFQAFLGIIEPFSHLPGVLGRWARRAKDAVNKQLIDLEIEMTERGGRTGNAWGAAFYNASAPWIQSLQDFAQRVVPVPGAVPGAGQRAGAPTAPGAPRGPRGRGVQVPTAFRATHPTSGLPGYPAVDIMASVGTPVLAPEDGEVYRLSGRDPRSGSTPGGPGGWSLYYRGHETGNDYFMTHLGNPRPRLGWYRRGDPIAVIGPHVSGSHVHVGVRRRAAPVRPRAPRAAVPTPRARLPAVPSTPYPITPMPVRPEETEAERRRQARERRERVEAERVTPRERAPLLRQLAALRRQLVEIVPANIRARMRRQLAEIAADIRGAVKDRDLDRVRAQLDKFKEALRNAVTRRERAVVQRQINEVRKELADVIPPGIRARLQQQLNAINRSLRTAVNEQQLQAVRNRLEKWKEALQAALDLSKEIRDVRKDLAELNDRILELPTGLRAPLLARVRAINNILGKRIVTQADVDRVRDLLGDLGDAIEKETQRWQEAVEQAKEALEDLRSTVSELWQGIAERALEVFDAVTEQMVAAIRAPFEALTPAERALEELQRRREALTRGEELATAQSELAFALRTGDPDLIRQAYARLAEIQLAEEEDRLEALAQAERKAADEAADREEKRVRDERDYTRDRFEARLEETIKGLLAEGATYEQALGRINALFAEFGISMETSGFLVGSYFALGFQQAINNFLTWVAQLPAQIHALLALETLGLPAGVSGPAAGGPAWVPPPGVPPQWGNINPATGWIHPALPELQRGGIVRRRTLAMIGEGGPEAVIPLSRLGAEAGGIRGASVTFNFPNYVGTRQELERAMIAALKAYDSRNGRVPIRVNRAISSRFADLARDTGP